MQVTQIYADFDHPPSGALPNYLFDPPPFGTLPVILNLFQEGREGCSAGLGGQALYNKKEIGKEKIQSLADIFGQESPFPICRAGDGSKAFLWPAMGSNASLKHKQIKTNNKFTYIYTQYNQSM